MLRFVVAMYLMTVTATGPVACCCTLTRLATRFVPSASTAPASPTCCHHAPAGGESKGEPDRSPPSDCPDAPGCPCKQAGGGELVAMPSALGEAIESSALPASGHFHFHLAILLDQIGLPASSSSVFREGVGTASRATTDDLLYAFHMLRC